MSGSTFQPPIHLDPTQDADQQTAFINQNFQTIASTLETNSIRIVSRGTTSIGSSGASSNWNTIPHNLGFAPVVFAYLAGVTLSGITTNANIPLPTWTSATIDTIKATALNGGVAIPSVIFSTWMEAVADTTNLYVILYNATGASISNLTVQYYLGQQPAS